MSESIDFLSKMTEVCQLIEELGLQYAEAKGTSWHMQEMRRVMLAHEMAQYDNLPVSQREIKALISDAYKTHLDGTRHAIQREHELKAKLERYQAQFEAYRSLCSLEKAKMNLI